MTGPKLQQVPFHNTFGVLDLAVAPTMRHETQMVRIWIIGIALALALAMPATAQQRSAPQILERLHALCDQDYKPACIKLGFVIGRLQPGVARKLRRDHPEWWWWERW